MLEIAIAAVSGILIGGSAVYFWITSGSTTASELPLGIIRDLSPFETNIVRMTRALVEEWETHNKKRSGLVARNYDTEFILTIRRPLEKEQTYLAEDIYAQEKPRGTEIETLGPGENLPEPKVAQ